MCTHILPQAVRLLRLRSEATCRSADAELLERFSPFNQRDGLYRRQFNRNRYQPTESGERKLTNHLSLNPKTISWNVKLNKTNRHAHVPTLRAANGESVATAFGNILPLGRSLAAFFRRMQKKRMTGHLNISLDSLRQRKYRETGRLLERNRYDRKFIQDTGNAILRPVKRKAYCV